MSARRHVGSGELRYVGYRVPALKTRVSFLSLLYVSCYDCVDDCLKGVYQVLDVGPDGMRLHHSMLFVFSSFLCRCDLGQKKG